MARLYDGSAVRKIEPKEVPKQSPKKRAKVTKLTDKQKRAKVKNKVDPFSVTGKIACVFAFFALSTILVYGYVQITEISNQIVVASTSLDELASEQIQLEMQVASIMNSTEVESYAQNQLGMDAVNSNQIIYVTMETENKGEIIEEESFNLWYTVLEFFGFR